LALTKGIAPTRKPPLVPEVIMAVGKTTKKGGQKGKPATKKVASKKTTKSASKKTSRSKK
jgi:hypothetical protein